MTTMMLLLLISSSRELSAVSKPLDHFLAPCFGQCIISLHRIVDDDDVPRRDR